MAVDVVTDEERARMRADWGYARWAMDQSERPALRDAAMHHSVYERDPMDTPLFRDLGLYPPRG